MLLKNAAKKWQSFFKRKIIWQKKQTRLKFNWLNPTMAVLKIQIGTVKALGLRRINQVREHKDTPVIRGMIFKVSHLIKILK